MKNKKIKLSLKFKIILLLFFIQLVFAFFSLYNFKLDNNFFLEASTIETNKINNENKEIYITDNASQNTIYWTYGIKPPKMGKENLTSGDKLFVKDYSENKNYEGKVVSTTLTYSSEFLENQGYYDLNKNEGNLSKERPYCYLASSSNMIYWWMDQNRDYIDRYISRLCDEKSLIQLNGLSDISSRAFWEYILKKPIPQNIDNYKRQELTKTNFVNRCLSVYLNYDKGYWMDKVIDYFINGYPENFDISQNNVASFDKSGSGGYFYPIFNKNRLTYRHTHVDYNFYKNNLKEFIRDGKGLMISYLTSENAHAITLWGVEYDSNGELVRVYITDSDDYTHVTNKSKDWTTGIKSMEVRKDEFGNMYLTSFLTGQKKIVNYIQSVVTFELGKEIWEEKLNDRVKAHDPTIIEEPKDINKQFFIKEKLENVIKTSAEKKTQELEMPNLKFIVSNDDGGELEYQWYKCDGSYSNAQKLKGEIKHYYKPKNDSEGISYYFCEAWNNKNGLSNIKKSKISKVSISRNFVDMNKPEIVFDTNKVTYLQYTKPKKFTVKVNSNNNLDIKYQWYFRNYGDSNYMPGTKLQGETNPYIVPFTDSYSDQNYYYYCELLVKDPLASGINEIILRTVPKIVKIDENKNGFKQAVEPVIVDKSNHKTCKVGDTVELSVNAKSADRGILSYQWYVEDYYGAPGVKLENEINNVLILRFNNPCIKYYYCIVTNKNEKAQNKTAEIQSELMEVNVEASDKPVISNNNKLKGLSVENYSINPTFSEDILRYKVEIPNEVTSVKINALKADEKAKVSIKNNTNLIVGKTEVLVEVKAENGDKRTYIIEVTRKDKIVISNNNKLKGLSVENYSINPTFSEDILRYKVEIPNEVTSVKINALKADDKAKVSIKNNTNLIVGKTEVLVEVKAENGDVRTYIIEVTRKDKVVTPLPDNNDATNNENDKNDFNTAQITLISIVSIITTCIVAMVIYLIIKRNKL